ncbi:MAG: DegV family protein [Lachnospiraceae bacterium]|nr:DegV family protein [Lachnospiraceae bacterium]
MAKVAVMTDSNSGITQKEAKELGVYVVPMPFFIDGELYLEDITLTREQFFKRLMNDCDITTSQPSPGDVTELWEEVLKEHDSIVYIPMSSGLSGSCQTAVMLAEDYDGKVQVVNNQRISVTQRQSVLDAMTLAQAGQSAVQIKERLEKDKLESSIYITVDTLKYLKKGGRVTPAAAAIGSVLNIKPVLQIQGEKLDSYAKVRGFKQAKKTMIEAMRKDLTERFEGKNMALEMAYTCSEEDAAIWKEELMTSFPGYDIIANPLSLSVACHIGFGSMAVACSLIEEA